MRARKGRDDHKGNRRAARNAPAVRRGSEQFRGAFPLVFLPPANQYSQLLSLFALVSSHTPRTNAEHTRTRTWRRSQTRVNQFAVTDGRVRSSFTVGQNWSITQKDPRERARGGSALPTRLSCRAGASLRYTVFAIHSAWHTL
jgi:hypothetical protein